MIRKSLVGLGALVVLAVAANYAPLLNSHSEQDDCTFGPISNKQYRSYLSSAKTRRQYEWPTLRLDDQQISRQLTARLVEMSSEDPSIYARMAVAHAILRSLGAEYLNTNGRDDANSYEAAFARPQNIIFNYQIDIHRFVWFQPYPRLVWVQAVFADPVETRPETSKKFGTFRLVAHVVSIFDHPPDSSLMQLGKNCPPMPDPAAASRLEQPFN